MQYIVCRRRNKLQFRIVVFGCPGLRFSDQKRDFPPHKIKVAIVRTNLEQLVELPTVLFPSPVLT